jgi:prepilin-type N-terminal cleavage/methylation domain-containing protein
MRRTRGFSLVELLIVIAIILVVTAIAIPNLLRSKISANEAAAVQTLRTIITAQAGYALTYPTLGYSNSLTNLKFPPVGNPVSSTEAGYLDWVLGCAAQPCAKSGYRYSIINPVGMPVSAYDAIAVPSLVGSSGTRGFCTNQTGAVRVDPNGASNCTIALE